MKDSIFLFDAHNNVKKNKCLFYENMLQNKFIYKNNYSLNK